jgi:hypothetical protein
VKHDPPFVTCSEGIQFFVSRLAPASFDGGGKLVTSLTMTQGSRGAIFSIRQSATRNRLYQARTLTN